MREEIAAKKSEKGDDVGPDGQSGPIGETGSNDLPQQQ
jgi:hypothetical protein